MLDAVLEICDDAILLCDADGVIMTWGSTPTRLVGRDAAHSVGRPLADLFSPNLRRELSAVLQRALAGERVRRFESEVVRSDGMPMPVSVSVCATRSRDSTAALVVILRDVTEQHLDQAVLAEYQRQLHEGEALAHIGRWLWDLRSGAVQWSAEFFRIHNVDPRDFRGSIDAYLEAVHPGDRDRVRAELMDSVRSGHPFETDYRVGCDAADQLRVIRVRAQPTLDSSGQSVGLRGIGQDVTDLIGTS